jgi:hypothetical protein
VISLTESLAQSYVVSAVSLFSHCLGPW